MTTEHVEFETESFAGTTSRTTEDAVDKRSTLRSCDRSSNTQGGTPRRSLTSVRRDWGNDPERRNSVTSADGIELKTPVQRLRWSCRRMLKTRSFDTCIGLVILANSVTIGIDQSYRLSNWEHQSKELEIAETCFLVIYIIELGMRFFGFGWRCIRDHWVKFDCLLVASSLVFDWTFRFILPAQGSDGSGPLMVLRTIRLARLARTIRLLIKFRVLWMLVRGLLSSAETMLYTMTVLLIMLYVFGTIGIELVTLRTPEDGTDMSPEFQAVVDNHFSTLRGAMLTLMQFACLDSIGAIYRPLIEEDLSLAVYFLAIILIIPVVLMNLVTAVIVSSAMEQATNDKEALKVEEEHKKRNLIKKAHKVFKELDEDDSNTVSREEMACMSEEQNELMCDMCGGEDSLVIFDSLDFDGSGEIDIDEFCDGVWRTVTSKAPIEMQRMERQIGVICERQRKADHRHDAIVASLTNIQKALYRLEEVSGSNEIPVPLTRSQAGNLGSEVSNLGSRKADGPVVHDLYHEDPRRGERSEARACSRRACMVSSTSSGASGSGKYVGYTGTEPSPEPPLQPEARRVEL